MKITKTQLIEIIREQILKLREETDAERAARIDIMNHGGYNPKKNPFQYKWFDMVPGDSIKHKGFEIVKGKYGDHTLKYGSRVIGGFHLDRGYTEDWWVTIRTDSIERDFYAKNIDILLDKLPKEWSILSKASK